MMSLPTLNAKRLSFRKWNAISARHDYVFLSASSILDCPHPRARSDPEGAYRCRKRKGPGAGGTALFFRSPAYDVAIRRAYQTMMGCPQRNGEVEVQKPS